MFGISAKGASVFTMVRVGVIVAGTMDIVGDTQGSI